MNRVFQYVGVGLLVCGLMACRDGRRYASVEDLIFNAGTPRPMVQQVIYGNVACPSCDGTASMLIEVRAKERVSSALATTTFERFGPYHMTVMAEPGEVLEVRAELFSGERRLEAVRVFQVQAAASGSKVETKIDLNTSGNP